MTVYFVRPVGQRGPVKIGFSNDTGDRLRKMATDVPFPLEVAAQCDGDKVLERRFHALFYDLRQHGEWFRESPEIESVISEIQAGRFDFSALPGPLMLPRKAKVANAAERLTVTGLSTALGISPAHASMVLNGKQELAYQKVAQLWRDRRWKVSLLKNASDEDCDAFLRIVDGHTPAPRRWRLKGEAVAA